MKIRTSYTSWHPTGNEWTAVVDDLEADSPVGYGPSEQAALEDLLAMLDDKPDLEALVEARLQQHKEANR